MDSVGFSLLALNPLPFRLSAASASSEARCAALFFGCPGAAFFLEKKWAAVANGTFYRWTTSP